MFVPKGSYLTAFQVHLWRVCAKVLDRSVPLCIIHVWPMCNRNVEYRNVKNWLATVKTVVAAFLTLQFLWHIELQFFKQLASAVFGNSSVQSWGFFQEKLCCVALGAIDEHSVHFPNRRHAFFFFGKTRFNKHFKGFKGNIANVLA